jgi:hypothetical protein
MALPVTFVAGDVLEAAQLNSNFTYLDGKNAGLVCVKAETAFTSVASFTADDVFTSAYSNYLIVLNYTQSNTAGVASFRYRTGGTSNSTANYSYQNTLFVTSATFSRIAGGATSQAVVPNYGAAGAAGNLNILAPQLSQKTIVTGTMITESASGNMIVGGGFNSTTQFDGIEFLISLGTVTGTYAIYGYSKTV